MLPSTRMISSSQHVFDHNTLTSVRSVSSISSTTSRSLNYDELPRVDQSSSFDILKICYALLIRILDLLHRLILND
ncbi:unnamed protein product [Rotaria magnacalcarata]|uniref:Uncharacterized protein n=1 Tax=Rotaria magnacalcarata TaxID=392030 RepID=A0A820HJB6_9BILA|nr:unnamed protein product [Rotaria magnacalcarata]